MVIHGDAPSNIGLRVAQGVIGFRSDSATLNTSEPVVNKYYQTTQAKCNLSTIGSSGVSGSVELDDAGNGSVVATYSFSQSSSYVLSRDKSYLRMEMQQDLLSLLSMEVLV